MKEFMIDHLLDDTYQVMRYVDYSQFEDMGGWECAHQGSLADCDAYIRLKDNENVDF